MKRNFLILAVGLLLGVFLGWIVLSSGNYFGSDKSNSVKSSLVRGKQVENFDAVTISGNTFSLQENQGKAVIINFWATWCPPCKEEMPRLQASTQEYSNQLKIVGVSVDTSVNDVKDYIGKVGVTFPIVVDNKALALQSKFNVQAFPTSFIIDQNGILQAIHIGVLDDSTLDGYLKMVGVKK
jgi:thiol-disulfide isomerase/thioredoxin